MATLSDSTLGSPEAQRPYGPQAMPATTPATDAGVGTTVATRPDVFNAVNTLSVQLGVACQASDTTITVVSAAPTSLQNVTFSVKVDSEVMLVTSGQSTASVFTNATGNQYLGPEPAEVHFANTTGASITAIAASKDNSTYENVYEQSSGAMAQDVFCPVDPGDAIKVTFSTGTQPTTRVRFRRS